MTKNPHSYVHGRSDRESTRLHDQATGLGFLLHEGNRYPPGGTVLEAGCGVGAQTLLLAGNSPHAHFVSIDISPESLALAEERIAAEGVTNVTFRLADINNLPFRPEHSTMYLSALPWSISRTRISALDNLRKVLRPNGI